MYIRSCCRICWWSRVLLHCWLLAIERLYTCSVVILLQRFPCSTAPRLCRLFTPFWFTRFFTSTQLLLHYFFDDWLYTFFTRLKFTWLFCKTPLNDFLQMTFFTISTRLFHDFLHIFLNNWFNTIGFTRLFFPPFFLTRFFTRLSCSITFSHDFFYTMFLYNISFTIFFFFLYNISFTIFLFFLAQFF